MQSKLVLGIRLPTTGTCRLRRRASGENPVSIAAYGEEAHGIGCCRDADGTGQAGVVGMRRVPSVPLFQAGFADGSERQSNMSRLSWRNCMRSLALKLHRFLVSEDGPTAVEYAVMLALIVVVCLTAISSLGTSANSTFQSVSDSIQSTAGG